MPSQLVEDTFWQVYFSLIKRKTEDVDWERDKIEEVKDEQPEGEPKSELDSAGEVNLYLHIVSPAIFS